MKAPLKLLGQRWRKGLSFIALFSVLGCSTAENRLPLHSGNILTDSADALCRVPVSLALDSAQIEVQNCLGSELTLKFMRVGLPHHGFDKMHASSYFMVLQMKGDFPKRHIPVLSMHDEGVVFTRVSDTSQLSEPNTLYSAKLPVSWVKSASQAQLVWP